MNRSPSRRARAAALAALLGLGLGAVACTSTDVPDDLSGPTTTATPTTTAPPPAPGGCSEDPDAPDSVLKSARPTNGTEVLAGTYVQDIVDRRVLRVGVDTSTLLWSYVEPSSGDFVGFDADIAREVARALFPDAEGDEGIQFVAIPYSQRVEILTQVDDNGVPPVDMVIDTFTINCRRDADIDFSTQYFDAQQKVLVPKGSGVAKIDDLSGTDGDVVCAPWGSTSIANLATIAGESDDPFEIRGADQHAECLVLLQQGKVSAISGDDTVLAGMVAQDPNIAIVGDGFSSEPYGIGLPPGQTEWVAYVNAVLDDLRSSGRWVELYNDHLGDALGEGATPPAARYDD